MISVVLVNWNGWADTITCIQTLLNSTPEPARIIVVDNDSTDNSMEAFECWANGKLELTYLSDNMEHLSLNGATKTRRVKFVHYDESNNFFDIIDRAEESFIGAEPLIYIVESGRNGGFGFGCNVGMRLADKLGSNAYWLLNNDCVVSRDALLRLSAAVRSRPKVLFGTIVRSYSNPEIIQAFGGGTLSRWLRRNSMQDHKLLNRTLDYIYGASMVFSDECRSEVGDFDEKIFMYYEEIDFCLSASAAGFICDVVEVDVFHRQGSSQGGDSSVAAWMHVLISKYYVLNKHFGWGAWNAFFFITLILRCLVPFGGKNASIGALRALKFFISKGAKK
jgi:GT2 family glycosyltransferase